MRALALVLAGLVAGCVQDELVACGDLACPVDFVCTPRGCASMDAAVACKGLAERATCTIDGIEGTCSAGACYPIDCGNTIIDRDEVCDDGNTLSGDGCAADCRSDERCGNGLTDGALGEQCDDGVAGRSGDGCTSVCTVEIDLWLDITPRAPLAREQPSLGEAPDGNVLMFGGRSTSTLELLAETWTWDGVGWIAHDLAVQPSPRVSPAFALDPVHERTVMFGGATATGVSDETWEWDGARWQERAPASRPPARARGAMAWDPQAQRVLLLGGLGTGGTGLNDQWSWDGTTWLQETPLARPIGVPAAMAYVASCTCIVVVTAPFAGVWRWTGATWVQLTLSGGPANVGAFPSVSFDRARGRFVLYANDETWELDVSAGWIPRSSVDEMMKDSSAASAYVANTGRTVIFGGRIDELETWEWNSAAWTRRTPAMNPQTPDLAVYDLRRQKVVGLAVLGSQTWEWNGTAWQLAFGGSGGVGLGVYDSWRDRTVTYDPAARTLGRWDGTTWSFETPAVAPSARFNTSIAFDSVRGEIVLFGGSVSNIPVGDTWVWNGEWRELTPPVSPPARSQHAMTYDPVRQRVVMFGGRDASGFTNVVWEWDGMTWAQPPASGTPPGALATPLLTYDLLHQRSVLVGLPSTWTWDGTTWRTLPVELPELLDTRLVSDARGVLLMGGRDLSGKFLAQTWGLRSVSYASPPERCASAAQDTDGDGLAGCADPDCWSRCTPLCVPGTTCDPAAPRCGDSVCDPVEDSAMCPSDCS